MLKIFRRASLRIFMILSSSILLSSCLHSTKAAAPTPLHASIACSGLNVTQTGNVAPDVVLEGTCQVRNDRSVMHYTLAAAAPWVLFTQNGTGQPTATISDLLASGALLSFEIYVRPGGLPMGPNVTTITLTSTEYPTLTITFTITII